MKKLKTMKILFMDEVSMMDVICWENVKSVLLALEKLGQPVHLILFGGFKQLPIL